MFSALLPDTASCKGFARPAATQQLPLELKLRHHNARSPFTPELAPYWRAFLPACVSTSPVAAVTSPGQPPAQPLTPRQRRLAQQRRKWEETQRQQQEQQPKQQTKQAAPVPKQAAAPTMGSGDEKQASSKARAKAAGPSTPASAPSAGAPPHSRAFDAPDAAAAAASAAPATTRQQPQGQARAREQPQLPQQPQRQEGGWPSLFDRDATLSSGLGDLRALSGPQLASLARQWADELADWRQRQRQRDGSSAASRGPPAAADGAPAAVPSSSSSSSAAATASSSAAAWQLPAAAASRLALLTAAVDSLLATHGLLGHQELADLAWCIEHYDREHALRWLHPAMGVPFRVVPQFMPGLRLEDFMSEVELRRDTIYLEDGSRAVEESRLTGWQSEIGATFKYSGKEMQPQPGGLSPNVLKVRDALTALTGVTYDSVLINYYADGKCGMRYHVDPLYDRWTPNSAVVSLGDTRTFIFREIQDHNTRWQYRVRNGDVILMYGDCQDRLQHCVRVEKRAEDAGLRMSLVFKERLRGPTGQYLMP